MLRPGSKPPSKESLDLGHGRHQPGPLRPAERLQDGPGQLVGAPVDTMRESILPELIL
jgi:hypothetical protein